MLFLTDDLLSEGLSVELFRGGRHGVVFFKLVF